MLSKICIYLFLYHSCWDSFQLNFPQFLIYILCRLQLWYIDSLSNFWYLSANWVYLTLISPDMVQNDLNIDCHRWPLCVIAESALLSSLDLSRVPTEGFQYIVQNQCRNFTLVLFNSPMQDKRKMSHDVFCLRQSTLNNDHMARV